MTDWISVEDRLPTPDRAILIYNEFGEVEAGYLCLATNEWRNNLDIKLKCDVSHWMPLPAPPEGL